MDELDLILLDEREIEPSERLAPRVLREIHADQRRTEGLQFPWRRMVVGLLACMLVVTFSIMGSGHPEVVRAISPAATWAAIVIITTLLLLRLLLDWAET